MEPAASRRTRRLALPGAALVALAVAAGCGEGDGGDARGAAAQPVGRESAGSVVQFADCADWRRGTPAERRATVERLRGHLTPQRSKSAASPLPDERAYELFEKTCAHRGSASLRLYKLYVRMQGFAPLSE